MRSRRPKKPAEHALMVEWGGLTAGAAWAAGGIGDRAGTDCAEVRVKARGSCTASIS
jgi:hypothetical protein